MRQPDDPKNKTTLASEAFDKAPHDPTSLMTGQSIPTHLHAELRADSLAVPAQTMIGRYQLEERLGAGSYGVVYRASDSTLRRSVAIKLLTRFENDQEIDAWVEEARVLAALDHPSIVPVYDIGRTLIGQPYIVSKFMGGGALSKRLIVGKVDTRQIVTWIIHLAEALDYLHHRHVMHRDIKPGNILLADDDRAVLADFGLALPEERYGKGARFVGTPAYMSPEQARREGHRVDGRSDIYSLGVVLYEMLTGQRPFRANNQDELLECIRTVEVRPLRQLNAEIPRELERVCLKTLAKKVVDRYATAGDMAEDLRGWLNVQHVTASASKLTIPVDSGSTTESASRSAELHNIIVVPHGLRPFDSHDADFFKYLLPGARDRFGVPDSINFWSSRILSRQASDTFRVGVLLGPSGSGKSSLVRAGILPLVGHKVHHAFVEAKPDGLEATLLKQITQRLPHLRNEGNLVDALIRFRQTPADSQDMKLLIVIDQFEQWLNTHRDGKVSVLHEALRQCDGSQLQALLLVRDDFMLGLTSFMDEIEEPILQNTNFATMERFGPAHARNVLAAFGRAYGALHDVISSEQEAFLDLAVEELSRAGNFEPVHLALLAEMIKDKPWNRATFRSLGGLQGLGVSFLEERLNGPTAHPLLRSEIQTVRRVLRELLPPDDTVIKPQPCTEQMILERLGGSASPETIDKILHLLDTEVRLITPTSSTLSLGSTQGSTGSTGSVMPAFQLTHDYLVPTIRKWLTADEESTRAGRVRVLLREMSASWNASPSIKRLPSLLEWLSIRWFTRPSHWSQAERRMLRALEKRLGVFALSTAALTGTGYFGYEQANWRMQVDTFATRLMEADTSRIAEVLESMGRYRSGVARKLNKPDNPSLDWQQRFHLGLLQLHQPSFQQVVIDNLSRVESSQLPPLIDYITTRYSQEKLDGLQQLVSNSVSSVSDDKPANLIPLVALLARLDADRVTQPALLEKLGSQLSKVSQLDVVQWTTLLEPIKDKLVPELLRIASRGQLPPEEADNYLSLILSMSGDNSDSLASAITWAPMERIKRVTEHARDKSKLATAVRAKLNLAKDPSIESVSAAVSPDAVKLLEPYGGVVNSTCAWAETVDWHRLNETVSALQRLGYAPVSVRPYLAPKSSGAIASVPEACVVWHKSQRLPLIESDLDLDQLKTRFAEMQKQRYVLVDIARYQFGDAPRWLALWHQVDSSQEQPAQQLELQAVSRTKEDQEQDPEEQAYYVIRSVDWLDEKGDVQTLNLFERRQSSVRSVNWSRIARANGDLYPNCKAFDIRLQWTLNQGDRGKLWNDIHHYLEAWQQGEEVALSTVASTARRLLAVNQPDMAKPLIESLSDEAISRQPASRQPGLQKSRAMLQIQHAIQTGQAESAKTVWEQVQNSEELTDSERVYWNARVSLASDGISSLKPEWLDELAQAAQRKKEDEVRYLKLLALIAAKVPSESAADKLNVPIDSPLRQKCISALEQLIGLARRALTDERLGQEFLEVEFDGLRSHPDWQTLMQAQQLAERWSTAAVAVGELTTNVLTPEVIGTHAQKAQRLYSRGYLPVAWQVTTSNGQRRAMSLWHRPQRPNSDLTTQAESTAKLSMALAMLGEDAGLKDVLRGTLGRGLAMQVALNAWQAIPAETLVEMLKQSADDPSDLRINTLIALGNYKASAVKAETREAVLSFVEPWAKGHANASLTNHARWCLKQWNGTEPQLSDTTDAVTYMANRDNIQSKINWFVNSVGQQMIVLNEDDKVGFGNDYRRAWVRIKRKFALSATEVSGQQMREFLDDPRLQRWIAGMKSERLIALADKDMPQSEVAWLVAIMYTQWLNERENVPPEQWCYKNVFSSDGSLPIPEPNYLQRTGYRLPTYAEWVVACQAKSNEYWHFGCDVRAANHFEWSQANAGDEAHPVGQLLPNHFGFYDMGGNLTEWTDTIYRSPLRSADRYWLEDAANQEIKVNSYPYQLGGRYTQSPQALSHRTYKVNPPHYMSSTSGFRLARTVQ